MPGDRTCRHAMMWTMCSACVRARPLEPDVSGREDIVAQTRHSCRQHRQAWRQRQANCVNGAIVHITVLHIYR